MELRKRVARIMSRCLLIFRVLTSVMSLLYFFAATLAWDGAHEWIIVVTLRRR